MKPSKSVPIGMGKSMRVPVHPDRTSEHRTPAPMLKGDENDLSHSITGAKSPEMPAKGGRK